MIKSIEDKRDEILRIASRYGARNIRLFGSTGRGEGGPESDIDLLIDLEPGRSLLDLVAIKQDLQDLLGCKVDVVTEAAISPRIRDEIIHQAVNI
jgi:predicted nucleotidyltransferase